MFMPPPKISHTEKKGIIFILSQKKKKEKTGKKNSRN